MATDGLSDLLAELRRDGAVDSSGRFTLDRVQARGKLQKFQLVDARRYPLELVQAAVLRGASRIDLSVDPGALHMRCDGEPFAADELAELWTSLFADGDQPRLRALRQLALGLNAALGLGPEDIVVQSGDREVVLTAADAEPTRRALADATPGFTVRVRHARQFGLLGGLLRDLGGALPEQIHVRERCAHADIDIRLDGGRVSRGLTVERRLAEAPIAADGLRGALALTDTARPAELRLVKDGVWIDSVPLPGCGPGLVAVVASDDLRRDVSLARVVDDAHLARVRALCQEVRWAAFAAALGPDPERDRIRGRLDLRVRFEALNFLTTAVVNALPAARAVADAITWVDARARRRATVSLTDLAFAVVTAADGARSLAVATRFFPALEPDADHPVPTVFPAEQPAVTRVLACRLVRVDAQLEREDRRRRGYDAWRARTVAPVLAPHPGYLVRRRFEHAGISGELALDAGDAGDGSTWLLRDGCLLARIGLFWGVPGVHVVASAPFTPAEFFDDVVRDHHVVHLALLVLTHLGPALAELVAARRHDSSETNTRVKTWLLLLHDPGERARLWQRLGVPASCWPDDATLAAWLPAPARLLDDPGPLAAIRAYPLFQDFDAARRSLADIRARLLAVGELDVVDRSLRPRAGHGARVLWLAQRERTILAALFGPAALRDYAPVLAQQEAAAAHRARPTVDIAAVAAEQRDRLERGGHDPALWSAHVRDGDVELALAVDVHAPLPDAAGLRGGQLTLHHEDRPLVRRPLDVGLGPVAVHAASPHLRVTPGWDDVAEDDALVAVAAAARRATWALFAALVRRDPEPRAWLRRVLLHRLAQPDALQVLEGLPDLRRFPLVAAADGRALDLDALERLLAVHPTLEHLPADGPDVAAGDPPILRVDDAELAALAAIVGPDRLVPASDRLQRESLEAWLATRPAIAPRLDPADALVVHDLVAAGPDDPIGQVGVACQPGDSLRVSLARGGRFIASLGHPAPIAMLAIVDDPRLPFTRGTALDLGSARYAHLVRLCRDAFEPLVLALCAAYPDLAGERRASARAALLAFAAAVPVAHDPHPRARAAVRQLPLVPDVWGRQHSLAALAARVGPDRPLAAVDAPHTAPPGSECERLIVQLDPAAHRAVTKLGPLRHLDARWPAELAVLRLLAAAPPHAPPDPGPLWIDRTVLLDDGLVVRLWLARGREPGRVALVHEGRDLGAVDVLPGLPCGGSITGAGLRIDGDGARLDDDQRAAVAREACGLVDALARQLEADPPIHPPDDLAALREQLARIVPHARAAPDLAAALTPAIPPLQRPAPPLAPDQALLALVRAELAWARERHGDLLGRLLLDRLRIEPRGRDALVDFADGLVLHQHHPLVARLLDRLAAGRTVDPTDLVLLVAAVYSRMNAVADELVGLHERRFLDHLAADLLASLDDP